MEPHYLNIKGQVITKQNLKSSCYLSGDWTRTETVPLENSRIVECKVSTCPALRNDLRTGSCPLKNLELDFHPPSVKKRPEDRFLLLE